MLSTTDLRPELRLPDLRRWVYDQVAPLAREDKDRKTDHIVRYFSRSFFNLTPHQDPLRYGTIPGYRQEEQKFGLPSSFEQRPFARGFGGSTGKYQNFASMFWDFERSNKRYSKKWGLTKVYLLKQSAQETLASFWRSAEPGEVVDAETGEHIGSNDLPNNGVLRTSYSSLTLPSLITFDLERLNRLIAERERDWGIDADKHGIIKRARFLPILRMLYYLRKWVITFGGIPNLYEDYAVNELPTDGTGRLYGIGELHLQRLPRKVRSLVYDGTGWKDFDFRSCHPTIFTALGSSLGLRMSHWVDYVANRDQRNTEIGEHAEITPDHVKLLVNSTLYGQTLAINPFSSLVEEIGEDAVHKLRSNDFYMSLRAEYKQALPVILQHHAVGDEIVNAVGKRLSIYSDNGKKKKLGKLLPQVLFGYEAWALETVLRGADDVLVLMSDGWVGKSGRDVPLLERTIREQSKATFGIELPLRIQFQEL